MKTKEQAIRYLSRRSYDEQDWELILQECHSLYGSGIRKSLRPKQHSTYQEFREWLDNGIGDGVVVAYGIYTGIFCDNGDGTYKLLAYRTSDDGIIVIRDIQVDIKQIKVLKDSDFYSSLRKQGLQYSVTLSNVFERKTPKAYSKILYEYNGVKGVGFVEKCIGGNVNFICCYDTEFRIGYSLPVFDVDFYDVDKSGIQTLQNEMNKHQVSFDKKMMSLVEIQSRAEIGGTYWYLTDTLSICRGIDKRAAKDNARYDNYNYFLEYSEALDMREAFIARRKEMIKGLE